MKYLLPKDLPHVPYLATVRLLGYQCIYLEGFASPMPWEFPRKPKVGEIITLGQWRGILVPLEEFK